MILSYKTSWRPSRLHKTQSQTLKREIKEVGSIAAKLSTEGWDFSPITQFQANTSHSYMTVGDSHKKDTWVLSLLVCILLILETVCHSCCVASIQVISLWFPANILGFDQVNMPSLTLGAWNHKVHFSQVPFKGCLLSWTNISYSEHELLGG